MGFIDNILENLGIKEEFEEVNHKITLIGDYAIYIEGIKSIKCYSKTEIILRLKKGGIKIQGEELFVKKYCEGDMAICGKIKLLERI